MNPDDSAVLARTAVDCARVGSLTTYARHASRRHTTPVVVRPRVDGTVEVRVAPRTVAAEQLLSRPLASLRIAPSACQPVLLQGAARRIPGVRDGLLSFHLDVAAVRVGAAGTRVAEKAYAAARPDPLRHDAPAVLAHLNGCQSEAIAACLRARGAAVGFVHAAGLDAGGLTLVVASTDGVGTVRLRFPSRVTSLSQLPVSLCGALSQGCGCSGAHPLGSPVGKESPAHGD